MKSKCEHDPNDRAHPNLRKIIILIIILILLNFFLTKVLNIQ